MRWTLLRLLGLSLLLSCAAAHAQTPSAFSSGNSISSSAVNTAMGTKCDVAADTCTIRPIGGIGRSLASMATDIIQAASYGVKCDGATNDSPALQAAINAGSTLGGRIVMLPATGHACRLANGVIVSDATRSGVTLKGMSHGQYWPGPYDNTESHWTTFGTWLRCEDTANSCITLNGNASGVEDLNFWYSQPTPGGSPCGATCTFTHNWTPIAYPFAITVGGAQNFTSISHITVVNGTNCINVAGPSISVGTIYTNIEHVALGCFNNVLKMSNVDNTVSINDFRDQIWWYQFSPDLVGYTEGDAAHPGHKIGWDFSYVSGLQATNVEFFQDAIGIRGTDATVNSGLGAVTFGVQAGQWANISFNQVCQAVSLASSTTHFSARLANVILNIDPQTSGISGQCGQATPIAFNLTSDNVDVAISNLDAYFVQTIAKVGAGTSGTLHVYGARSQNYGAYVPGGAAFIAAANASLDIAGDLNALLTTTPTAGPRVSGLGNFPHTTLGADIEGQAGTARQLRFLNQAGNAATGGGLSAGRWAIVTDSTAESGGNAGSNFGLYRFNDAGGFVDAPISVPRATGVPAFANGLQVTLPTSCTSKPTGTVWNNGGALAVCP